MPRARLAPTADTTSAKGSAEFCSASTCMGGEQSRQAGADRGGRVRKKEERDLAVTKQRVQAGVEISAVVWLLVNQGAAVRRPLLTGRHTHSTHQTNQPAPTNQHAPARPATHQPPNRPTSTHQTNQTNTHQTSTHTGPDPYTQYRFPVITPPARWTPASPGSQRCRPPPAPPAQPRC